jgi:hypothetical protein
LRKKYVTEWSAIENLRALKSTLPSVTTSASAKWLPDDVLLSEQYIALLQHIRQTLKDNLVDTVCLNIPDETMSDKWLRYFLDANIIPHVRIDGIDVTKLSEIYVGETDDLSLASKSI